MDCARYQGCQQRTVSANASKIGQKSWLFEKQKFTKRPGLYTMGRTDNQVASSSKAAAVNSRSSAKSSKGRGSREKAKKTPASTSSQDELPTDDTDNQQLVASITKQVLEQLNSRSTRRPSSPDSSHDELEEESDHPGRTRGRKRTRVTPKKSRKRHRHKSPRGTPSGSDRDISTSSDSSACSSESGSSSESDEDSSGFSGSRTRISSTIASQIDQKLKNKIWQRKYINLAKLLPQYKDTSAYGESIHLQSTGRSQFRLLKKKSAPTIRTIDQWTSAFLRYVAIYAEKFPKEIPQVIKHGEIVRDLAARKTGDAWFIYDQRVRAEIEVSDFPWGPKNSSICALSLQQFISLCETLGVPIKDEKTEGPSSVLTFLGIELDTVMMEARLPVEKVVKVSRFKKLAESMDPNPTKIPTQLLHL
ncbi:hypothetical protein ScPMuIL_014193 [Solemya velum]